MTCHARHHNAVAHPTDSHGLAHTQVTAANRTERVLPSQKLAHPGQWSHIHRAEHSHPAKATVGHTAQTPPVPSGDRENETPSKTKHFLARNVQADRRFDIQLSNLSLTQGIQSQRTIKATPTTRPSVGMPGHRPI